MRERQIMLELEPKEVLVITLQGVVAKLTMLNQLRPLNETEMELGARATRELMQHIKQSESLSDKINKATNMSLLGKEQT